MCPSRFLVSGGFTACSAAMHPGMIPKRNEHVQFVKSTIRRPVAELLCYTVPHKACAMCPSRFLGSGGFTACSAAMHTSMIPNGMNMYNSKKALFKGLLLSSSAIKYHTRHVQCAPPDFPFQVDLPPAVQQCTQA
jgi:hypothetical protein